MALFTVPCPLAEKTLIPFENQSSSLPRVPEMSFSCHQYIPQWRIFSFPLGELREDCLNLYLLFQLLILVREKALSPLFRKMATIMHPDKTSSILKGKQQIKMYSTQNILI